MSIIRNLTRCGLMASASLALASAVQADPTPSATPAKPSDHLNSCFSLSQWQGWSAPSENVIYMRVRMHDIYRVELSAGSSLLQAPQVHLVNIVHGPDSVCWPIDLQLSVSDGMGMRIPLIAKSISKLSPEEVAAIPKKYIP